MNLSEFTTPEQIEAIERADILTIKALARALHETTPGILETPMSRADYEQHRDLRTAMKIKLEECKRHLKTQIADMDAIYGELEITKKYQVSDEKRLDSLAWSVPRSA